MLLCDDTALMHFPLTPEIGAAKPASRLGFPVSILFVREAETDWWIQSPLTTHDKGSEQ